MDHSPETIDQYEADAEKSRNAEYKTLTRRFFASMLDFGILGTAGTALLIIPWLFAREHLAIVSLLLTPSLAILYPITTTKLWGGTFGKLFFRVRVYSYPAEGKITWLNSVMRELINILLSIGDQFLPLAWFVAVNGSFNYPRYRVFENEHPSLAILSMILALVSLIELASALFSAKRRSFHDFVGGTVVKAQGEYPKYAKAVTLVIFLITLIVYLKVFYAVFTP